MNHELDRRLANIVRIGTIAELNEVHAGGPHATVDLGDVVTEFLPCATLRAGPDKEWSPPEPGEQVLVLSPSGELAQGIIVPCAVFSDANQANGDRKTLHRRTYADGTVVEYDREAHVLTVDASASNGNLVVNAGSGNVTVNCATATVNATESVTLDTPQTTCTGNLSVQGVMNVQGEGASGAVSTFAGTIIVTGGDVEADSITLKGHGHIEQGDGNRTSNAVT